MGPRELVRLVWPGLLILSAGCQKKNGSASSADSAASQTDPPKTSADVEIPPLPEDDSTRWLAVEDTRRGAEGGWATGSFDPKKNRIEIRTKDVRQFSVDVSRIPIAWEKLVILSIDGVNSELRRREFTLLHFRMDDHGQWNVLEK